MADNVAITAGSGTTIATDETGSAHYQKIKLVDGTADATGVIAADIGAKANALRVVPASDITDATYIGDIKFGESLPSGTAAIGKLAANSGVDIGDVDVTSLPTTLAIVDDEGFTPAVSRVIGAGFTLDNTSTDVIDEGDIGIARMTSDRKQIVVVGEAGANHVKGGGSKTDTSDQALMAATGDANISNYLNWVTIYNASSTNTYVNIKDGSTVIAVLPAPAYGGCVWAPPMALKATANTAINAASGASVTTMYMYGGGYKGR